MIKVDLNPILVELGPIRVTWYGLMYVFGFIISYLLVRYQVKKKDFGISLEEVEDFYFYLILGLIAGARLGYVLFYDLELYLSNPLEILAVWHGGMSFHGGLIGVLAATTIFCWKNRKSFWKLADLFVVTAPVGLGLGRIGNFINGELYGRITSVPWGMIFPGGGELPRHPSQLYESFLEGLVLFFVVRIMARRSDVTGITAWTFCAGYGLFRFIVEFFRQPDAQVGFFLNFFSMGQLLSLPMFLAGSFMIYWFSRRKRQLPQQKG